MSDTIGLYLETNSDHPPTLIGLSEILRSFDDFVSEVTFIVDPTSKLTLQVHSIENGSIKFESVLKFANDCVPDKKQAVTIITVILVTLFSDIRSMVTQE